MPRSHTALHTLWLGLALCASACKKQPVGQPSPASNGTGPGGQPSVTALTATAESGPAQASLLDDLPDGAMAALVIRQNALTPLTSMIVADPDTQTELSDYLDKAVGVDFTRVQGIVGFVTSASDTPSGAVLFVIPGAGALHRPKVTTADGIDFYDVGAPPAVAAVGPAGVVIGTQDAVDTEIQLEQKKGTPLSASSKLGFLLQADAQQTDVQAGIAAAGLPPSITAQIGPVGIDTLDVRFGHGGTLTAVATGDPAKLTADKSQIDTLFQMALDQLKSQKDAAKAGDDIANGVGSILAYHLAQKYLGQLEPTLNGNQLSATFTMPRLDMSGVFLPLAASGVISYLTMAPKAPPAPMIEEPAVEAPMHMPMPVTDSAGLPH
jgi:hypothetical protein